MAAPKIVVLASRPALEELGVAADFAIDAVGGVRAGMTDAAEATSMFDGVDAVIAEVTRPSPSISFEVGVAAGKGIPVLYLSSEPAISPPVFSPVVQWSPDERPARMGFAIAKHLEDLLRSAGREPDSHGGGLSAEYQVGEVLGALVRHVNRRSGFLLAGPDGRRPAMLHVSRMSPEMREAFEGGRLEPGIALTVEVIEVDLERDQVQLRDAASPPVDGPMLEVPDDRTAALLRLWNQLETLLGSTTGPEAGVGQLPEADAQRFRVVFEDEIHHLRQVRNRIAHGRAVSDAELETALEQAHHLRRIAAGEAR